MLLQILAVNCNPPEQDLLQKDFIDDCSLSHIARNDLANIAQEPPVCAVLIGSHDPQAILTARTAHGLMPDTTLIFLCGPSTQQTLQAQVQNTPFLGRAIFFADPASCEELRFLVQQAASRCERSRKHRQLIGAANAQLSDQRALENESPNQHKLFLNQVLDNAPIGVMTLDKNQDILSYNSAASTLLELATSSCLLDYFPESSHANLVTLITQGDSAQRFPGMPLSNAIMLRNSPPCWVNLKVTPLQNQGNQSHLLILEDITGAVLAEEELKTLNQSLEARVKERTADLQAAHSRLERRNQELKRSNLALDEFAYISSHDLREPLRALHNYSAILQEDLAGTLEEEHEFMLGSLTRVTQRMEDLIESLLDYSRLGRVDFAFAETDMQQLISTLISDLAMTRGHVNYEIDNKLPNCLCDPTRIATVFRNLASNGIKYNHSEAPVIGFGYAQHETEGGYWYVRDNGIGIPDNHQDRIFQVFKRLHPQDKYGGGTGVGLTFSRRIVERHGGKMWLESEPGKGAKFCFTLNASEPVLDNAEADDYNSV